MKKILSVVALGLSLMMANAVMAEESIQIKGSDTIVHLSSAWAEAFMKTNPAIQISVTGGGSGTGISALLNGTCDIANASRVMKASEINAAKGRGFTPKENIVGLDGIAVITNPSNGVKALTMQQVKQIFTGEKSNWKQFGGPNQKIAVYTRDSSSGTFAFFQEHVLLLKDYSVKARRLASNAAIVQAVSEDASGIGYVGMGYLADAKGKVKVLAVAKDEKSTAILPDNATVKNASYPVSRGLQMYTKGEPAGTVKQFMDYIFSADGQKIVEEMGFVSIK